MTNCEKLEPRLKIKTKEKLDWTKARVGLGAVSGTVLTLEVLVPLSDLLLPLLLQLLAVEDLPALGAVSRRSQTNKQTNWLVQTTSSDGI